MTTQRQTCKYHPSQEISFVCLHPSCLRGLCKVCAAEHDNVYHAMEINDSFSHINPSKIKTFDGAATFASQYLKENITFLGFELEKLDEYFMDFENFLGRNKEHKEYLLMSSNIIAVIKRYLKSLEKEHRRMIAKTYEGYLKELKDIKDKILHYKTSIQELLEKVNASKFPTNVDILKQVFRNDFKSELNTIAAKSKGIFQDYSKDNNENCFFVEHDFENILKGTLSNIIRFVGKDSKFKEDYYLLNANSGSKKTEAETVISNESLTTEGTKAREKFDAVLPLHSSLELEEHKFPFSNNPEQVAEYFNESARYKVVHFFNPIDNTLEYINLNEEKYVFNKIKFYSQNIPTRHRSLITPSGQIIMIGGVLNNHSIKNTFVFRWANKDLQDVAMMKKARKSPSICFHNNHIYVFGGVNSSEGFLRACERYNVILDEWEMIEEMPKGLSSAGCCVGLNDSIFLIGGLCGPWKLLDDIYKYKISDNTWVIKNIEKKGDIDCKLFWLSSAISFRANELIVLGGINEVNQSQDVAYKITMCEGTGFFRVSKEEDLNKAFLRDSVENKEFYQIEEEKGFRLPHVGGFWSSAPVFYKNKCYFLQNIVDENDIEKALEDKRRLLVFSDSWKTYNI